MYTLDKPNVPLHVELMADIAALSERDMAKTLSFVRSLSRMATLTPEQIEARNLQLRRRREQYARRYGY